MEKELRQYLENEIISVYKKFDKAHQKDHVYRVIEYSLAIAKSYDVLYDMVFVIACYHDIGMLYGRDLHHLTGGGFLFKDNFLRKWFTVEQMIIMKEAIEDHRASCKIPPRSIYGKIIAEADRDIDPDRIILRTVQVAISKHPQLTIEQNFAKVYKHLIEKYGPDGYLKLWLKTQRNQEGLFKIHQLLENKKTLQKIVDNHYKTQRKSN